MLRTLTIASAAMWFGHGAVAADPFSCNGQCAATIFVGKELDTALSKVLGYNSFTAPYDYTYNDSYFVGGALSRELLNGWQLFSIEIEAGLGKRFGSLSETEAWAALYGRWLEFPWNRFVKTTVAISTGINWASDVPQHELNRSGTGNGSEILHYFSPEITFAHPDMPDRELIVRLHHRSGMATMVPAASNALFHGAGGGVQYLAVGLRQRF